jgi:hypothetical protein
MEYSKHNKAILYHLHSKACAMADVLRNSIYGIMSAPKQVFLIRIGLLKANPCFGLYRFLIRIGLLKVNRTDRFGREKNRTEINQFELVFGLVWFKN